MLNSNQQEVREDLVYSKDDLLHLEEWTKVGLRFANVNASSR